MQRKCPVCSVIYDADPVRLKHGRQTTCSRACSYALRGNQRSTAVVLTCPVCGDEFTRASGGIKSKHEGVYCSRTCHYAGRTAGLTKRVVSKPYVRVAPVNYEAAARAAATRRARDNYGHSEDALARMREATTRRIAEGRISKVSKLEDVVAAVLDEVAPGYTRQFAVRGPKGRYVAAVDFLLADGRVLEVNGTFWHADPRVYPDGPRKPSQLRSAAAWDRKVAALAELSIPLLVVWELDICEDAREAVRVALAG